jgi:beta-alanine degradation protein BauB
MVRSAFLLLSSSLAVSALFGQDIVKLAPDRVTVEFENAQVRVLRFKEPPGSKLPMHSHPAHVAIGFTDDYSRYTFPDGTTAEEHSKAGSVDFGKPVTHAAASLGDNPSESLMIELKTPAAGVSVSGPLDPATVDPKHVKVELDNDLVRVQRFNVGPHETVPMHAHPAYVQVSMSGSHLRTACADGKTEESSAAAGQVRFSGPVKHSNENLSDKPSEVIVVELKTAAQ